jgi:hypothetical protein
MSICGRKEFFSAEIAPHAGTSCIAIDPRRTVTQLGPWMFVGWASSYRSVSISEAAIRMPVLVESTARPVSG